MLDRYQLSTKIDFNLEIKVWELEQEFKKIKYPNGFYEGLVKVDTADENGIGRQIYSYGIYEGQFEDSQRHGWGREINHSGEYKEGNFRHGFFYEGERYD